MPCSHPIQAWKTREGIKFDQRTHGGEALQLPCGRCARCKLEHSRQWAVRGMHELQMHEFSSFVNLTYNDEHCPDGLKHEDFQKFMKRLRKARGVKSCSYYMAGEYGERTLRPHYHAILYGIRFPDRYYFQKSPSGFPLYRSPELERLWPLGNSTIGEVSFESVAYVARYIMKKQTLKGTPEGYDRINLETGERVTVAKEYARMSRNPAIGRKWIEKYNAEVYPNDYVVSRANKAKPPRYYDNYLKTTQPELHEQITLQRKAEASTRKEDNSPQRLADKEAVAIARTKLKSRQLE
ncbi:MAG: replication initiator protein [Microviridae sp.]|nr:MAG: replication initiator protein [Microviridae sp.]